jgi:hypothetical protein
MKVFKIEMEIIMDADDPNWLEIAIDEQLKVGEAIVNFKYEELQNEPS